MEPRTYKVTKIDGDYAHLLNVDTGEDLLMARALLPDETDEGTMLHCCLLYTSDAADD